MKTFERLVAIRVAFSKLNVVDDWIKRRQDALHYDIGEPAALLVLQKVIMNSSDDPHEIQLVMIKSAFRNWEGIAYATERRPGEVWDNIRANDTDRGRAFCELKKAIYDDI